MSGVTIGPAHAADIDVVKALLEREHLPTNGLDDLLAQTLVASAGNRIVGCAGVELYDDGALLRSVAVDPEHRGTGVGGELTRAALRIAEKSGVDAVYLQTTAAEQFFPRFGFTVIDRADLPPAVRSSWQFTSGCCASAIIMRKVLTRPERS